MILYCSLSLKSYHEFLKLPSVLLHDFSGTSRRPLPCDQLPGNIGIDRLSMKQDIHQHKGTFKLHLRKVARRDLADSPYSYAILANQDHSYPFVRRRTCEMYSSRLQFKTRNWARVMCSPAPSTDVLAELFIRTIVIIHIAIHKVQAIVAEHNTRNHPGRRMITVQCQIERFEIENEYSRLRQMTKVARGGY